MHINFIPASPTKGAVKEHVFHSFLRGVRAHRAVETRYDCVVTPLEPVPCVDSVRENKPAEELQLWGAFRFPEP